MARSSFAAMASIAIFVILSFYSLCLPAVAATDADARYLADMYGDDECPVEFGPLDFVPIKALCGIDVDNELCCEALQNVAMDSIAYNSKCLPKFIAAVEAYTTVSSEVVRKCMSKDGRSALEEFTERYFMAAADSSQPEPSSESYPSEAEPSSESYPSEAEPSSESYPSEAEPSSESYPSEAAPSSESYPSESYPSEGEPSDSVDSEAQPSESDNSGGEPSESDNSEADHSQSSEAHPGAAVLSTGDV
ncbi:hypothetical protein CBR_g20052 [Chara braunii]|uniref:Prolamin-like domain-containing protein n=1 Tax=Chara braunii TaxID=69332 RepID=A0A388KZK9_CHABU|nr:hypothetical protein CBR_g20052 [Chara braunii]|eukprot:GBG75422.1 hypothetical protein CBR_g20052 [Chara braunii]